MPPLVLTVVFLGQSELRVPHEPFVKVAGLIPPPPFRHARVQGLGRVGQPDGVDQGVCPPSTLPFGWYLHWAGVHTWDGLVPATWAACILS